MQQPFLTSLRAAPGHEVPASGNGRFHQLLSDFCIQKISIFTHFMYFFGGMFFPHQLQTICLNLEVNLAYTHVIVLGKTKL